MGKKTERLEARGKTGALVKTLRQHKDWSERHAAADALGRLRDPRAVEPLVTALDDRDSDVRSAAAEALVKFGAPAVEPLLTALEVPVIPGLADRNSHSRSAAAEALAKLGDSAVEPLTTALSDGNSRPGVRVAAAHALGRTGNERAVKPLITALGGCYGTCPDAAVREEAARALGAIGDPRAVKPLITALDDRDPHVRNAAAEALVKFGDAAVEPLIAALGDGGFSAREAAPGILGAIGSPRAVEALVSALQSSEEEREAAAEALVKFGDAAVEPLITALADDHRWQAYGGYGAGEAKQAVARVLGAIGARAVEPLITALQDPSASVREASAKALKGLGYCPQDDAGRVACKLALQEWTECAQIGTPAVGPLIIALGDKDKEVRAGAAYGLGTVGDPRAVEPLVMALHDPWRHVREAAARALLSMYASKRLDARWEARILENRPVISAKHYDHNWGDWEEGGHTDEGIGVRFPL